ncbi:MAG: hypothetical protein R3Y32_01600 [Bacillota bacterium]
MNAIDFLQGINDIRDEYIINSCEKRQSTSIFTMKNFKRVTASVACIALIFVATSLLISNEYSITPSETLTTTAPTTDVVPTMAPMATLAPSYTNNFKISKITMILITSRMSYSIESEDIETYISLQNEELEIFENLLTLYVSEQVQSEQFSAEEYNNMKENAVYFYDDLTKTQVCIFDKYIEVITAGDVNASVGIFEIISDDYNFNDYFAVFFE